MKMQSLNSGNDFELSERWFEINNRAKNHPVQQKLLEDLKTNRYRNYIIAAGRRSFKTERFAKRYIINECMEPYNKRKMYFAGAPTRQQAKEIFWDDLKKLAQSNLVVKISETALKIYFNNGCILRVIGLKEFKRVQGQLMHGIVISEYQDCSPGVYNESIEPMINDTRGWCIKEGRPFGKKLTETRKNNIFIITDAFAADENMKSLRWLAYILATAMHESNDTFAPVAEGYWIKPESKRITALYNYYRKNNPAALKTIFPTGRSGTAYYGRGRVVQLTHDFNYRLASLKIYNDDRLFRDPEMIIRDAACDLAVTFRGMLEGWFTGYRLEQFFPLGSNKANWRSARKMINGLDKANLIAGYAMNFYDLLEWE